MPPSPPNSPFHHIADGTVTFSKTSKTHTVLVSNFGRRATCESENGRALIDNPISGEGVHSYKMKILSAKKLSFGLATELNSENPDSVWTLDESGSITHGSSTLDNPQVYFKKGDVLGVILDRMTGEMDFTHNN